MSDRQVIHKYVLPFLTATGSAVADVPVPFGHLLHLDVQRADICLWAVVDPDDDLVPARFHLVGTGQEIRPTWCHLGSVLDRGFVWHVYAEPPFRIRRQ